MSADDPFASPAFRSFVGMRACAVLAGQVQLAALGWWVWTATGDPLDLAWVGLAQFLPVFLLSIPAGVVADRFERRSVLRVCQLAQGAIQLVLAGLATAGAPSSGLLFAIGLAMGTARAFANPTIQALLGALVRPEALSRGYATSATVFQLGTVVGPGLAGLVLARAGAGPTFVLGAALLLGANAFTGALPSFGPPAPPPAEGSRAASLLAGLRYVRDERLLLACTTLDLFAVLLGGATALLPVFATDLLGVDAVGYGVLRAAPALGGAAVAVVFARGRARPDAGGTMLAATAVYGLATLVFGLSRSYALSLGALAVLGAADMVSVVVRQTLVQIRTPDAMRGRVAAVNQVFVSASNELGEFESGLAARLVGPIGAVVGGALGTLAVTAAWARLFPELRARPAPA